jgi:TfoX/Sxy family transcriptional regulator of competence genes
MRKQHSYRPKFAQVPEEMRRLAVLLEEEVLRWPNVSVKPMFGMRAIYHGKTIFGLLPEAKMINRSNAIGYKFAERPEAKRKGHQWQIFEVEDESSLTEALQILHEAYNKAITKRA